MAGELRRSGGEEPPLAAEMLAAPEAGNLGRVACANCDGQCASGEVMQRVMGVVRPQGSPYPAVRQPRTGPGR